MDGALRRRKALLAMDAKTRIAARKAIASKLTNDAAGRTEFNARFPNATRLKIG
jgi:hypothetical protein